MKYTAIASRLNKIEKALVPAAGVLPEETRRKLIKIGGQFSTDGQAYMVLHERNNKLITIKGTEFTEQGLNEYLDLDVQTEPAFILIVIRELD